MRRRPILHPLAYRSRFDAQIRPPQLKRAVAVYGDKALRILGSR